ncbi:MULTISPECIES: hypothetical protein [unclassified Microbacterium]|uniref:hypothetical protein n=1 Tax=unclassified Microbacterium TaxID=2609290 RepID=UPI00214CFE19|nr:MULTISPECIES: hypothetical protein [unclassified Microbacterium]MCR2810161.1 hypothetical protein [Microbacterium sp. zg.B185]WIM20005.1 hypothetical protein QNO12_04135 [Microbacterium sp. zg-B185]
MSVLSIVASSGSVLTAALLVLTGSPAAAAETAPALPIDLVLHLPAGLSVEDLRAPGDHGSLTVAGCPADGALLLASTLQSPTGDGGVVEVPMRLETMPGSDDGPVAWQLRGISAWLAANDPGPLSSVLLEASCMRPGNETARVTAVLPPVGAPLQSLPPATPATPVPEGGVDPVTVPAASEPSAAPRMLAESGAPTLAAWPIVVGVLLILAGSAAVAVRGRRVH